MRERRRHGDLEAAGANGTIVGAVEAGTGACGNDAGEAGEGADGAANIGGALDGGEMAPEVGLCGADAGDCAPALVCAGVKKSANGLARCAASVTAATRSTTLTNRLGSRFGLHFFHAKYVASATAASASTKNGCF